MQVVDWCHRFAKEVIGTQREVMDDAQRGRLVSNVVGHLKNGVTKPVLKRAVDYWRNIDMESGDCIAKGVHSA